MQKYVLTVTCPGQPEIVRALADGIVEATGNIVDNVLSADPVTDTFCVRTHFETPVDDVEVVRVEILARVQRFAPIVTLSPAGQARRVLVMVSRFDHCLVDLLYRWRIGALPVDVPLVVSNHNDVRPLVYPQRSRRLVRIGGGMIGLEVAAAAAIRGLDVEVAEAGPRALGRDVPDQLAPRLVAVHRDPRVAVRTGAVPAEVAPSSTVAFGAAASFSGADR
jgi:formyltetrahydrofolate deformylase